MSEAVAAVLAFVATALVGAVLRHRERIELRGQHDALLERVDDAESKVERLQHALARATERLHLATSTGQIGIWDHEPSTGRMAWDDRMLRIHGVNRSQLQGTLEDWFAGVHEDDRDTTRAAYLAALATSAPFDTTFRVVRPGGEVRWLRATAQVHRDEHGAPTRVVGVHEDLTDHRVVQDALHAARAAAEAASGAKSRFLANMSHEIRTPMNAVTGLIFLLLREPHTPRVRQKLMKINDAAYALLGIIDDILDFSKIEAGKLTAESIPFSIPRVVGTVLDMVRVAADAKGLSLEHHRGADVPETVVGDPTRLSQILTNLLSNAVTFTHEGTVALRVSVRTTEATRCQLDFEVSDTGIGMDPNTASRVFQPFQQADASPSRASGGTGLGLAIVHSLVGHLEGELHLDTAAGEGSTFRVTLPFEHVDASLHAPEEEEALGVAPLTGLRLLVVDDHPVNREVAQAILEASGAIVEVADNGATALEALEAQRDLPDAVLMDIQMPRMDGLQATKQIRATPRLARVPVVAMTANATVADRRAALAHGMDDFVTKPFDTTDLFRTVLKAVQRRTPAPRPRRHTATTGLGGVDIAAALARMGGDRDLLDRQLERLVHTGTPEARRARELAEQGDLAGGARLMHRIKGAASNLGATEVSEAADAAERRLRDEGWLEDRIFDRVDQALDSLARALAAQRPPATPSPRPDAPGDDLAVERLCGALRDALRAQTLEAEPLLDQLDELLDTPTRHALQLVRAHVEDLQYPLALSQLEQLRLGGAP